MYIVVRIFGTFVVAVDINETMYNIVSLRKCSLYWNNIIDHGFNDVFIINGNKIC